MLNVQRFTEARSISVKYSLVVWGIPIVLQSELISPKQNSLRFHFNIQSFFCMIAIYDYNILILESKAIARRFMYLFLVYSTDSLMQWQILKIKAGRILLQL